MKDDSNDRLAARVQSLPQELYDEIYKLTFTAAPGPRYPAKTIFMKPTHGAEREIHGQKRPIELVTRQFHGHDAIALLQVDQASREKFARSYYGGPDALFMFNRRKPAEMWLKSLSEHHRGYLRHVGLAVLYDGFSVARMDSTMGYKLAIDRHMFRCLFGVELRFTLSSKILDVSLEATDFGMRV
ncbi:hypothetical protein PRZ48_014197 [Zasmidium cellare]|uniref:Uncharacterized protein n=1 Tax=Zasmidium cellare TaxID=395010 RepID=A0ABR0E0S0_ZASCE|nr:hypothetical protein PRZ48_014197 [Zasmidium cellare]